MLNVYFVNSISEMFCLLLLKLWNSSSDDVGGRTISMDVLGGGVAHAFWPSTNFDKADFIRFFQAIGGKGIVCFKSTCDKVNGNHIPFTVS